MDPATAGHGLAAGYGHDIADPAEFLPSAELRVLAVCPAGGHPAGIDSHVHAFGLRADPVRFGITAELDMFTFLEHLGPYREQRESTAGTRFSDLWTAGTLVTLPGGYGTEYGPIPTVSPDAGGEEVARFVHERLAEGSDYIKVIKDHGNLYRWRYPTLRDEQVEYVIEAAHEFGARCVVHVARQRDARVALEAGADGLAHVPAERMGPGHFGLRCSSLSAQR